MATALSDATGCRCACQGFVERHSAIGPLVSCYTAMAIAETEFDSFATIVLVRNSNGNCRWIEGRSRSSRMYRYVHAYLQTVVSLGIMFTFSYSITLRNY